MNNFHSTATSAQPGPCSTKVDPRRKAPKTDEQLLADAVKRTGLLRTKVIMNRDRQRMELVDDLHESKRLVTLRAELGL